LEYVNREEELSILNQAARGSKPELMIIYGRRRIGKTALVREFSRHAKLLYLIVNYEDREKAIDEISARKRVSST